jgi:DNA polymerase III delta prime subunit
MFDIKPAVRKATPALISLWGPSGCGKTFTALLLARGLVGEGGKIGMVDTENRRAEFYADMVGGWDHLDLQPPFTPERYVEAIGAFEQAGGYDAVIIDSASHEWQGEGGVLEMADEVEASARRNNKGVGLNKWRAPKMSHLRFQNKSLRAPFHVIFCLRAKEKFEQKGDSIMSKGLVPICQATFPYEMTISARLELNTHEPQDLKCPAELLDAFPRGKPITIETGVAIADWISGGEVFDTERASLERAAREVATFGTAQLEKHWKGVGPANQRLLKPMLDEFKGIATEADLRAEKRGDDPALDPSPDDPLDDAPPADALDEILADAAPPAVNPAAVDPANQAPLDAPSNAADAQETLG